MRPFFVPWRWKIQTLYLGHGRMIDLWKHVPLPFFFRIDCMVHTFAYCSGACKLWNVIPLKLSEKKNHANPRWNLRLNVWGIAISTGAFFGLPYLARRFGITAEGEFAPCPGGRWMSLVVEMYQGPIGIVGARKRKPSANLGFGMEPSFEVTICLICLECLNTTQLRPQAVQNLWSDDWWNISWNGMYRKPVNNRTKCISNCSKWLKARSLCKWHCVHVTSRFCYDKIVL